MIPLPNSALIVGHPGHELRLFHWLECAHPLVFVITDGSGAGHSRVDASRELLASTACEPGAVMGAFSDSEIYHAMMRLDVAPVAEATRSIADALIEQNIECVVNDAFEFYNPTHDLCSVMAGLAAMRAQITSGRVIERYDYAVTAAASQPGIVFALDPETVERKLAAAYRFDHLTSDVNVLLTTVGKDDLAREILRPVSSRIELAIPAHKPYYETHGEERVRAGRYQTVLRYQEHFVPFVEALAAELGLPIMVNTGAAIS